VPKTTGPARGHASGLSPLDVPISSTVLPYSPTLPELDSCFDPFSPRLLVPKTFSESFRLLLLMPMIWRKTPRPPFRIMIPRAGSFCSLIGRQNLFLFPPFVVVSLDFWQALTRQTSGSSPPGVWLGFFFSPCPTDFAPTPPSGCSVMPIRRNRAVILSLTVWLALNLDRVWPGGGLSFGPVSIAPFFFSLCPLFSDHRRCMLNLLRFQPRVTVGPPDSFVLSPLTPGLIQARSCECRRTIDPPPHLLSVFRFVTLKCDVAGLVPSFLYGV